jgi:hypothetical protein
MVEGEEPLRWKEIEELWIVFTCSAVMDSRTGCFVVVYKIYRQKPCFL